MSISLFQPKKSLNKAFLRVKPHRTEIDLFKKNLAELLSHVNENESEEHHKNLISDFLKNTYYSPDFYVNTKGYYDLVIHNGKNAQSSVGIIIEAKRPLNKSEMIRIEDNSVNKLRLQDNGLNVKAFQELIFYYLKERISNNNLEIKHLIVTNLFEWFVFDAKYFENHILSNKNLIKNYNKFINGQLSGNKTDFFYKEIASPFILQLSHFPEIIYFDLRNYKSFLNNEDNDENLIVLFKVLSPQNLMKLPFINDSNSLDKTFYTELLHIIGLTEKKDGSKKLITRKEKDQRNKGSIIENTIVKIDSLRRLHRRQNNNQFGETIEEQLFNVSLELSITWVNRILFLKLLEAQLLKYHNNKNDYKFLSINKIRNFDELNEFFFQVLACVQSEREQELQTKFPYVPYLNSSLFEPTELEQDWLFISNLNNEVKIPLHTSTVLKDSKGKRQTGELNTLEYLYEFLDAYDFSSEGSEEIQEENKSLISAAVLGLIFEKINGYRDGSFYTPSYITMYICRETIRRAVLEKFNTLKKWECKDFTELYNKIEDIAEANDIINSLRICDPAVGSGHFLVSALNEIITIKSDLKILCDRNGRRLKEYRVEVEIANDELIIFDQEGDLFVYNPKNVESQRIQEAIFHEKQTIIEKCLFGVDINPNSVKICRLRLWIELLKNTYYKSTNELETLPNIDINIKTGNSLVSRFPLDVDLRQAFKSNKIKIKDYKDAVYLYQNAPNKDIKYKMEYVIEKIKSEFKSEIKTQDPRKKKLDRIKGEKFTLSNQLMLFEESKTEANLRKKKIKSFEKEIASIQQQLDAISNNHIFQNSFEWRFEFPEVLNDEGDFVGFDCVITNPPYVYRNADIEPIKSYFQENYLTTSGNYDLYKFFIERCISITKENGFNSLITNSSFLLQHTFFKTRSFILDNSKIHILSPMGPDVFDEATVDSAIYVIQKNKTILSSDSELQLQIVLPKHPSEITTTETFLIHQARFSENEFKEFDCYLNQNEFDLVSKLLQDYPSLETGYDFGVGINTGYIKNKLTSKSKINSNYHPMVPGSGISRYGVPETEGFISYDKEFVKSQGKLGRSLPDEIYFSSNKILVVRTRNLKLKQRIVATIDYEQKYNLNRLSNIISKPGYSLEGLLGVLNSSLYNWLYSKKFLDYEIKPIYLKRSPLCDTNNSELISLVKELLAVKQKSTNIDTSEIEKKIDGVVYKLFNLSAQEIIMIEDFLSSK